MRRVRQGDIWFVDLDPTTGGEQQGRRPVVVLSNGEHNRRFTPIVAPITTGAYARSAGFTVPLTGLGLKTDGVVLAHQIRLVDILARNGKPIEAAPLSLIGDVFEIVATLIDVS